MKKMQTGKEMDIIRQDEGLVLLERKDFCAQMA